MLLFLQRTNSTAHMDLIVFMVLAAAASTTTCDISSKGSLAQAFVMRPRLATPRGQAVSAGAARVLRMNPPADVYSGRSESGVAERIRDAIPRRHRKNGRVLELVKTETPTVLQEDGLVKRVRKRKAKASAARLKPRPRMQKAKGPRSNSRIDTPVPALSVSSTRIPKSTIRLTREDEVEITELVQAFRQAVRVRDEMSNPTEEEWAEACGMSVNRLRQTVIDGQDARFKLVEANAGLVTDVARRYSRALRKALGSSGSVGTILSLQDLIQEGNLGIMEAAERFDPEKGFRFSTYAVWWIRQRIGRAVADSSRIIRLPSHVHTMLRKVQRTRTDMQKEMGRQPTLPELAHRMNISTEKLRLYADTSRSVLSLEMPLEQSADDKRILLDVVASKSPSPLEDAEADALREDILDVVDSLGGRERDVLITRFGLDDGNSKTLEETAKRLGISRDRVRVVEARALNKLRHPHRNYKLKEYISSDFVREEQQQRPQLEPSPMNLWSF